MNQAELFYRQPEMPQPVPMPSEPPREPAPPRFDDVALAPPAPYAVELVDYAHAGADAVRVATRRFERELERLLGNDVLPALRAFQNASESSESDLAKEELALAKRWAKAYEAARTAGFRDLGDTDEAYFEVRPL